MTFAIVAGIAWVLLTLPVGMLIGRGMRAADDSVEAPADIAGVERLLREHASARRG